VSCCCCCCCCCCCNQAPSFCPPPPNTACSPVPPDVDGAASGPPPAALGLMPCHGGKYCWWNTQSPGGPAAKTQYHDPCEHHTSLTPDCTHYQCKLSGPGSVKVDAAQSLKTSPPGLHPLPRSSCAIFHMRHASNEQHDTATVPIRAWSGPHQHCGTCPVSHPHAGTPHHSTHSSTCSCS
jgi:hypothetical protein